MLISANQGLLTGYPDGSFKPGKGVTRAEAAAILTRLKAQLVLREKKGCEYVCTVGEYWLMQYSDSGSVGLALYEPLTGKLVQTVGLWKAAQGISGYAAFDRLLSGSDGIYVWGRAGLYKRSGNTLEQIVAEPVLDFCWYGDNTLYYLSWDDTKQIPAYYCSAAYFPCASSVMKLENPGQNAVRTILAERDESSPMQNLTDIYVEYGTLYVAGSYCMGIADLHRLRNVMFFHGFSSFHAVRFFLIIPRTDAVRPAQKIRRSFGEKQRIFHHILTVCLMGSPSDHCWACSARLASRAKMASRRLRLMRPCWSMSVTLTTMASPTATTSSTRSTRLVSSLEICTRPSLPGAISTKAPKFIRRVTLPL